jgi:hypothetical protein
MKKFLSTFLAAIALTVIAHAQEVKKSKNCGCSFSSINQAGLLEGSTGTAFQVQTVNGMRFKNNWFAGVGIGYDRYRIRSIPLFLDLRWTLFNRPNTPFVYGDIGYNFDWPEDRDKTNWWSSDFSGGVYYDAGVGYRIGLGKKHGIVFSGGFSFKKLTEKRSTRIWCDFPPFCSGDPDVSTETYDFKLSRISLKAGIQL